MADHPSGRIRPEGLRQGQLLTPRDTIVAVATPPGRGGVGVIRLSGRGLESVAHALCGRVPRPRHAHFTSFVEADGQVIDSGLLLYFPAPASFTGEDVLELQGHGGPIIMELLQRRCLELGARLARPGEFSERAFLNGKIDLAQAEAIADLIDASTAQAARGAVRSLRGEFSRKVHELAAELLELRVFVEATLDFPEEELEFLESARALERLGRVDEHLARVEDQAQQGQLLRNGLHVVLAGQPNVGKSSLLNALAGDELAIVTPIAGTTRDVVRGHLQLNGIPLHVIDTAGLRSTDDQVERLGIDRTWKEIEQADVIVILADATQGVTEAEQDILRQLPAAVPRITVFNKIDLAGLAPYETRQQEDWHIGLSARSREGLPLLQSALLHVAGWHPTENTCLARERHLQAIARTRAHLSLARGALPALELMAEELRLAHQALGEITGEVLPDDLLGAIFSKFCIGK